jgi:hypothetical protein
MPPQSDLARNPKRFVASGDDPAVVTYGYLVLQLNVSGASRAAVRARAGMTRVAQRERR